MSAGGEVAPSTVDMSDRKSRMVTQQSQPGSRPTSPDRMVPLYDKDLIRMLAEVAFIQGEVYNYYGKIVYNYCGIMRQIFQACMICEFHGCILPTSYHPFEFLFSI